jgi:hypothetical protein
MEEIRENFFVTVPCFRAACARAALEARLVNVMRQLPRAADLASIITFATGLIVGSLIPSEDWLAIITAIVAGFTLQSIVNWIDRKRAECSKIVNWKFH